MFYSKVALRVFSGVSRKLFSKQGRRGTKPISAQMCLVRWSGGLLLCMTKSHFPGGPKVNLSEIQDKEGPVLPGSGLLQEQL